MSVIGKRIIVTDADYEDIAINRGIPTRTITVNITNGAYSGDSTITEGTTAQIVLTANTGYKLPNSISVTAADYTYNKNTGVIVLSNPNEDITISAVCQEIGQAYTITTTIVNGTYTGDTQVYDGETAYVTISANEGYRLPHTITVVGATSSYDRATGIISLTNPTSNITITGECKEIAGGIPELVQGYWSANGDVLPNRVCNETLTKGIQTITTKPGYVIRAVYAYTQEFTHPQNSSQSVLQPYYAVSGGMIAEASTTRTTYTTPNANYYYGFTFTKTNANANILPSEDIVATWSYDTAYTITANITNGSAAGDTSITDGGTATVTISPNNGYTYPEEVNVQGATFTYNNGVIVLTDPTDNITITGACVESEPVELPTLVQGYWSDNPSLGALPNRVCNETLIQGIQTVTTKPGYVIRAVYAYTQPHTWEVGRTTGWEGVRTPAEAATSTSRTTYTTLNANYYYGFTFTKTDANANILPSEDIIESWVKE